jgi:hypothetical protein
MNGTSQAVFSILVKKGWAAPKKMLSFFEEMTSHFIHQNDTKCLKNASRIHKTSIRRTFFYKDGFPCVKKGSSAPSTQNLRRILSSLEVCTHI